MIDSSNTFWEQSWVKHIESYLNAPPRTGIFLKNHFKEVTDILEIAGGSCRDSRYLAHQGYKAVGSDFDEKTLNYLQQEKFPYDLLRYSCENAFHLTFEDNTFDLVFHNGFFICFSHDHELYAMLKEQYRVSKKYIIFFVHNVENKKLVELFHEKTQSDKLYDIRFFEKNETMDIVRKSGIHYRNLYVLKFGGKADALYKKTFKKIIPNIFYPFREKLVPKLYQWQSWQNTERICCVIELDK